MQKDQSFKGFTLIELLVVIAIIGLLSTLAVVALNSARIRSRDAKRASDIRQVTTALAVGYTELNQYPNGANGSAVLGSATATILCKDNNTPPNVIWTNDQTNCASIYMGKVPAPPPSPINDQYVYFAPDDQSFSIVFTLEQDIGDLLAGQNCANEKGIQPGSSC